MFFGPRDQDRRAGLVAPLAARGLVNPQSGGVKVLGEGDAPTNLTVKVHKASAGARKKIEDAGGSVEVIR